MDDVEIKFKARIGDVATHSFPNKLGGNNAISHDDLQMEMDGIKSTDDDVMEITIRSRPGGFVIRRSRVSGFSIRQLLKRKKQPY